METFYIKALKRYKANKYTDFHKYITKKLIAFYKRFDPAEVKEEPAEPGSPKEGDVVEVGNLPDGSVNQLAYEISGDSHVEADDGGSSAGPPAAQAAAAAEAAAASPVAAPAAPASG
jgi:hypothetical protein